MEELPEIILGHMDSLSQFLEMPKSSQYAEAIPLLEARILHYDRLIDGSFFTLADSSRFSKTEIYAKLKQRHQEPRVKELLTALNTTHRRVLSEIQQSCERRTV